MPALALEHLAPVPFQMVWLRLPVRVLRVADRPAVVGQQRLPEARRAVGLVGDEQDAIRDREGPQVESLVVQDAEGQPVVLRLRAAGLVPADMGGVQGDRHRAEPHVEAADSTAVLVGLEHPLTEGRVALPAGDSRLERQADRIQDVRMERLGEVPLENPRGDSSGKPRIGGEGGLHVRW